MSHSASGTIPSDGVVALLRELESRRTNGLLRYETEGGARGEVWLRLGHLDPSQPDAEDGTDPVERFLAARGGRYEVLERLPPLEGAEGNDQVRKGSLGHHSVADLMNYAEGAGLNGVIRVERESRVAEIVYVDGVLDAIYLDRAENDVDQVFGWSDGSFSIRIKGALSIVPPADSTGARTAPRIIERDRNELLVEAAQRRPRAASIESPKTLPPRREGTVRIVLLGGQGEALVAIDPERARARAEVERAFGAAPPSPATPRPIASKSDRRLIRAQVAKMNSAAPEPIIPLGLVIMLGLLLFTGLAAFVAVLLRLR